jgi:hypothetical protein
VSRASHFNTALNNLAVAEFFCFFLLQAHAAAFDCLAWEVAHAETLSMYRMNSPEVGIAQDLRHMVMEDEP